ncbi:MAG: amidophosphoribosyltransferase [Armatimonadota bacterium]
MIDSSNPTAQLMPDDDRLHEECGIFAIWAPGEDVARISFFGLFALQHRGQEGAGIAVIDDDQMIVHKDMGLVTQVFKDESTLENLKGHAAIGHTRYSTTGSNVLCNTQPIITPSKWGPIAVAHNGGLVNAVEVRRELEEGGVEFETTNDTEAFGRFIAASPHDDIEEAIADAMMTIKGAYSVVMLTEKSLYVFRDSYGVRPLCVGRLDGNHLVFASETSALNVVGAHYVRDIEPGELVIVDKSGVRERRVMPTTRHSICVFEYIYFARPDSKMLDKNVHTVRKRLGHELALEYPCPGAHMVFPIPDTGTPAAIGFAEASGIPYGEGVIKNRYIHRTFIHPDQRMRELGVKMKLTPLRENLAGKKVVMVDDTIVRGTTTANTVKMIREAGAVEVHVRITAPPYRYPCFYGIDTGNPNELIAAQMDVDSIRKKIGADTLGYLSIRGLIRAVGLHRPHMCMACLDSRYPIALPEEALTKNVFEVDPDDSAPEDNPLPGEEYATR